jgi:RHS repeat-associated protein
MKLSQLFSLSTLLVAGLAHGQDFTNSGWFLSARESNAAPQAITFVGYSEESGGEGGSLASAPEIAEAITPEIQALARGLENDPKRIFDHVHDRIRYVHYFGSKKGAQLTLLERSGNDFDQCALLVALLRAAGHTASYQFGTGYLPYESSDHRDYRHWIGTTKPNTNWTETAEFAFSLNNIRGFPSFVTFNGDNNNVAFHRVWVKLTWSGTNYLLDPAFKVSEPVSGINLATAMGLDTNQLMTAAGGTSTAAYVQSLSESALRNKLRDYTTNLLFYLQSNYPNASVEELLGGQQIVSSATNALDQGLPFTIYNHGGQWPVLNWDYVPTNFMATVKVTVDGTNQSLFMPQLQGKKLALTFDNAGLAELWLDDDERLLQKQTSASGTVDVVLSVDHPHGSWNFTSNTLINEGWNDHTTPAIPYQATNATYALCYAFEPDGAWLRQRQERLDAYRAQGLADDSKEVLTETLNVMGLSWLLQTERIPALLATQQEALSQHHHRFGRMAQEVGKGYYIDVYQQLSGIYSASGSGTNELARSRRVFDVEIYFSSAAEHALIEQLQSSNIVASSTVKMLQVANASGQRTYLAASSNWTTGANVRGQLTNYNLGGLDAYINAGYTLLLPQNGLTAVAGAGSWKGYGLVARGPINIRHEMHMLISGGYNGAFTAFPDAAVDPATIFRINTSQPDYFIPVSALGADPVSMADGSFLVSKTDFVIGEERAPRGIAFTRYYSSARRHHDVAELGHGWTHNYRMRVDDVSAPLAGLGDTTPAQLAPMIVAIKSALGLYVANGTPKNWAVTSLIAKWGLDQLINNAVSVTLGNETIQFIKQPNGTFTPSAGSTMTLIKTNSAYWLRERQGNTFQFHPRGHATNIVDQYGQATKLFYDINDKLWTVTDWKGRGIRFSSYAPSLPSPHITTVFTDYGNMRFGYSIGASNLINLVSATDFENKTNTFLYDSSSQIVGVKDALNQLVVSNIYDGFGRVVNQYTEGDTNKTWQIYCSGWETVEEDPAGGKRHFLYDDKTRLVSLQDALGNITRTSYDGQDHVVRNISPLNETNRFEFDGRHNLLRSIDPLNFTNSFFYDSQDRLFRTVDARGNTNHFGYNIQHRLIGTTNGAGDWVAFTYNTDGTLATRADLGGVTSHSYDAFGQLSAKTYPGSLGGEGFLNSSDGDVLSHTNARSFVTSFQYNARRELTNTIAPTNLTAAVAYDGVGNVVRATDARGLSTTNKWSATQKLLATTLPQTPQGFAIISNVYDGRDLLSRTVNPLQHAILYTNDVAQRLISMTDPLLRTKKFSHDEVGRQIGSTNAANEVTRRTWNHRGELVQTTDAANYSVQRAYDAAGNQVTLTNRNGKKWQFQFDAADRLTNTITPLLRETRLTYNNRGLLSTVREPSSQTSTNLYDAKGRLTNRADQVASAVFRYDANDNLTNIVEAGKTNAWTFDAYDRVATYRDADGNLIQYAYDQNGNLTNLVYPGSKNVFYAYDSLNRLTNVVDWANRKTSIEYDLASRVRKITRPNGTVREMNYDAAGQTTNIIERTAANVPIAFLKLSWNAAARVDWEFVAPLPQAYTPPTRAMTHDDDNRIATFNGNSVAYDLDGNLTSGPLTNNSLGSYVYDARNRLLSAGGLSYGYDPAGDRTSLTNSDNVTKFVINPNAALSQVLLRVKGGVTNYYVYGLGLLYEADDAGSTKTYHYDSRGSTLAITDANGAITDRIEYSAYGTTTYRDGTTDTPFLYNGRYGVQSDPNGLLYMRARHYNPYLCRFLNSDPAGFSGALNFYAYADGDPISLLDPFGLGAGNESLWSWIGDKISSAWDSLAAPPNPEERIVLPRPDPNQSFLSSFIDGTRWVDAEGNPTELDLKVGIMPSVGPIRGQVPPSSTRPPNLTPPGAGRTGALREALRRNGVPTSKQPDRVLPNLDKRGKIQPGRVYEYDVPKPGGGIQTVRIRDDAGGSYFGPGNSQNRGPHFNDAAKNHYDY